MIYCNNRFGYGQRGHYKRVLYVACMHVAVTEAPNL